MVVYILLTATKLTGHKKLDQMVALLICIQKVSYSNLCCNTDFPDSELSLVQAFILSSPIQITAQCRPYLSNRLYLIENILK
jgi:hypothetical protein